MQELNRNVSVAVGTDNVELSGEKNTLVTYRKFISIVNTSTAGQIISISVADEGANSAGIPLSVGGLYLESEDAGFKPTNRRICAVSSAAAGSVAISERIIQM